jgi:glycosyltransferase 2 family protein
VERVDRSRIAAGLVGVLLAGALLAWSFNRAGFAAIAEALAAFSVAALIPALICETVVQLSKALKWTAILSGLKPVKYRNALSAVVLGAASTHLVPLRLDEVLRAALLARREGLPAPAVLGTVAIDRVVEVLIAGVLLGAVALGPGLPSWMRAGAAVLWGGFAFVVLALIVFLKTEGRWADRLKASKVPGFAAAAEVLGSLATGLRSLPRGKALIGVGIGAIGEWGATIAFYAWMLKVFSVDAGGTLSVVMALGNTVAYAVPNVPGAIGTYEALQSGILEQAAQLPEATALAIALAAHGVLMVPVTVAGLGVGLLEWRRGGLGKEVEAPESPSE